MIVIYILTVWVLVHIENMQLNKNTDSALAQATKLLHNPTAP